MPPHYIMKNYQIGQHPVFAIYDKNFRFIEDLECPVSLAKELKLIPVSPIQVYQATNGKMGVQ